MRGYAGPRSCPRCETAGFDPATVDVVAMSHLHFDHAGGLLRADGARAFPRATIVAQRAEWRSRSATTRGSWPRYEQPELRLVEDWGADGCGRRRARAAAGRQRRADRRPFGRPPGDRRPRAASADASRFFGDLCMRPWSANPRWVTAFDDFPLDSVAVKASLFAQAADEGWIVVLSHEPLQPIGGLVRDRDRFRFEPT